MGMQGTLPLIEVRRGGHLESVHRGSLVVLDGRRTVLSYGAPATLTFYRSTSKPLQALVAVTSGAVDAFGMDDAELALAAGSHNAEPRHLAAARSILAKAGLDESALRCGGHWSIDPDTAFAQRREVEKPPAVFSNCSGKHAMMLATAKHLGLDTDSYLDPAHPVQATIRAHVARLAEIPVEAVAVGVDNCGAPAFAVPLAAMARSLSRFAAPDLELEPSLAAACRRVARAARAHPHMIAGRGRFDTDLMVSASAPLVAKAGAEGVHGWAVVDRGLAMAVKAADGRDRGYRRPVVEILARLGLLTPEGADGLRDRQCDVVIRNWVGREVGRTELAPDLAGAIARLAPAGDRVR